MNAWLATDTLPVPSQVCANGLWDHIRGWEVIVAVLIIMGAWASTNIARMHYMVKMAQLNRPETRGPGHGLRQPEPRTSVNVPSGKDTMRIPNREAT